MSPTLRGALLTTVLLATAAPASAASWWERLLGGLTGETAEDAADPAAPDPVAAAPVDFASALREALTVGAERVVERLGQTGGFSDDAQLHIALPSQLDTARDLLERVGLDGPMDDLELRLNRAAETATPRARARFIEAIRALTIDDARSIIEGDDTEATDYLRSRMTGPLTEDLRPIIDDSLAEVGAVRVLDSALARYGEIPFAPPLELDLGGHVTERTIDGIFLRLADEERAIREDPAARTTELLRAAFDRVTTGRN